MRGRLEVKLRRSSPPLLGHPPATMRAMAIASVKLV
jgi:hypothetical protein